MNDAKITLGILQRISEFLAELPEDQLADLAEGRARLAYVPDGSANPVVPGSTGRSRGRTTGAAPTPDVTEIQAQLEVTESRERAAELLAPLKKPALLEIAKSLSVPNVTKLTIDKLRHEIVEATAGRRLDSVAIRGFNGLRP